MRINHCDGIDRDQPYYQFPIWDANSNAYAQFGHIISISGHSSTPIVFSSNTFTKLGLSSSLVFLSEKTNQSASQVVFEGNKVSLVKSYYGTAVLDLRKTYVMDINRVAASMSS
jgi:hypothetical protein